MVELEVLPCSPATGSECKVTEHDHDCEPCNHCYRPIHYDTHIEDYVHDDFQQSCFLVSARKVVA